MDGLQGLCSHCAIRAWQVWRGLGGIERAGGFASAMGQTRYRLVSCIKAVLRAGDVCCVRAQILLISKRAKEGEATRVGLLFRRNIVMVTTGIYADKALHVLRGSSAHVCAHVCVCQKEEDDQHLTATLIRIFQTKLHNTN